MPRSCSSEFACLAPEASKLLLAVSSVRIVHLALVHHDVAWKFQQAALKSNPTSAAEMSKTSKET